MMNFQTTLATGKRVVGQRQQQSVIAPRKIQLQNASAQNKRMIEAFDTYMEFVRGVREAEVPDIKLQRTRDGLSGYATLTFKEPSIFNASSEVGDVTGLYLVDDEGEISTTDVKAVYSGGAPSRIVATVALRSKLEWDRFMRFMEKYGPDNGLQFQSAKPKDLLG